MIIVPSIQQEQKPALKMQTTICTAVTQQKSNRD